MILKLVIWRVAEWNHSCKLMCQVKKFTVTKWKDENAPHLSDSKGVSLTTGCIISHITSYLITSGRGLLTLIKWNLTFFINLKEGPGYRLQTITSDPSVSWRQNSEDMWRGKLRHLAIHKSCWGLSDQPWVRFTRVLIPCNVG